MKKFENQDVFEEQCPAEPGPKEWQNSLRYTRNVLFRDLEFVNCKIIGAGLASYGGPIHRSTAEHIRLKNCVVNSFFGKGAIFDDVVVDGLRTTRAPVTLSGCAFRHVVFSGKCGRFLFNRSFFSVLDDDPKRNSAFDAANAEFYKDVDWALDITSLNPAVFEIRGSIPCRLIRRNPEVHFMMTRAVALEGRWRNYEPFDSFQIGVSTFLKSGAEENLFVAPQQSKAFKEQIEFFHRMKSAGLVT